MTAMAARRQKLTVVHFTPGFAGSVHASRPFILPSLRYWIVRTIGWLFWITLTIVALLCGQYYALAYYLLMPITGLVVRATHGFEARQLMYLDHPSPDRLVVITSSLNASEWWAFYGKPGLINAILNKPIYRSTKTPAPIISQVVDTATHYKSVGMRRRFLCATELERSLHLVVDCALCFGECLRLSAREQRSRLAQSRLQRCDEPLPNRLLLKESYA